MTHRSFNQGPLCGRGAALRVCSSLFRGTTDLLLTMTTQTTTDLRLSRVRQNSQAPAKVNSQDVSCGFGFAWWHTMPSCPVHLDPGPGVSTTYVESGFSVVVGGPK